MTTYTSTIHVDVPTEVAFAQVITLMMTSSGRTHCTLLEGPPDGLGTRFRYEYRMLGLGIGGTCTITEHVRNRKIAFQWHGPERIAGGNLLGVWTFTPEDGGTNITVQSIFEPRIPLLHRLAAKVMIRAFRTQELPAVKAKLEEQSREAQPHS